MALRSFCLSMICAVAASGCDSEAGQRGDGWTSTPDASQPRDSDHAARDADPASDRGLGDQAQTDLVPHDQGADQVPVDQGDTDLAPTDQGPPDLRAIDLAKAADSAVACSGSGLTPGNHEVTLQHGGLTRSYRVHVPQGYTHTQPVPLVLAFHGFYGNAANMMQMTSLSADSDLQGFVAAFPQGYENSWNGGVCCGEAASSDIDDVGFVRAVVADLRQKLCIDGRRTFATGFSNGGFLSNRLACEASDLFAAIAPVCGALGVSSCSPGRPVPVIMFNGTDDTLLNYNTLAVPTFEGWVQRNGCTDAAPTETYHQGDVRCVTYAQCQGGVEVTLCTVDGGGHCWPGRPTCTIGTPTTDISANEAMWGVFGRFPLP